MVLDTDWLVFKTEKAFLQDEPTCVHIKFLRRPGTRMTIVTCEEELTLLLRAGRTQAVVHLSGHLPRHTDKQRGRMGCKYHPQLRQDTTYQCANTKQKKRDA